MIKKDYYGLPGSSKSAVIANLSNEFKQILVITSTTQEAQWLKQEISVFSKEAVLAIFPSPDVLPGEANVTPEIVGQRLFALNQFVEGRAKILIAPLRAIMYKTIKDAGHSIVLSKGAKQSLGRLIDKLIDYGYKRLKIVGEQGEFSIRGGILDIFPSNELEPKRIEFYEDEIESIRGFDPVSQRSKTLADNILILKNVEERQINLIESLNKDAIIVFDEQELLSQKAKAFLKDAYLFPEGKIEITPFEDIINLAEKHNTSNLSSFARGDEASLYESVNSYVGNFDKIKEIQKKVLIVSKHAARITEFPVVLGQLRGGFETEDKVVLTDRELFNEEYARPKAKAQKHEGVGEEIRADFQIGDYVVHEDYGIGIYQGLKTIEEGEYVLVEFDKEDRLYVPSNLVGKLEKYVSEEGYKPKLSRMGTGSWQALRREVKKSVKDLTQELLKLYAERKKEQKEPYSKDDVWQKELEDSFPYEETEDQLKAIADVKRDLESTDPMERLLCGDVGYGKTEVSLRAIVKVLSGGKQVAVLVPTTILAEQHYHFFKERLSTFPFKIASLSRFRSKAEQKQIVEQLKTGEVDVVVGTHRLLQKDISFKDLGLVVIDEEHRFGVAHKEKMKKLKKNIDVLSMTATPIPRSLYMSLSGARDLSIIQTPPADRSPVRTYVTAFNETLVREAVLREFDRGGQVFFVHNRVESIESFAKHLKEVIPEAEIAVAHGQMHESKLEKIMEEFLDGKFNILLCTSIIESGLDMPNVNTILIDKADRLGLAQLYQLRGRVGRSPVKAYAYLLYNPEDVSTQGALSRLKAISEFTSLGAGYKLALRDLEMRGAGNLLGAQQHGHMLSVGFDLYCELIEEAVNEIKGIKEPTPRQVVIDINEEASIPPYYVEDEQQRIALYRRLNLLSNKNEIDDFKQELTDRFGKIPESTKKLFEIVNLKANAIAKGIKSIRGDDQIVVQWVDGRTKRFNLTSKDKIREIKSQIGL